MPCAEYRWNVAIPFQTLMAVFTWRNDKSLIYDGPGYNKPSAYGGGHHCEGHKTVCPLVLWTVFIFKFPSGFEILCHKKNLIQLQRLPLYAKFHPVTFPNKTWCEHHKKCSRKKELSLLDVIASIVQLLLSSCSSTMSVDKLLSAACAYLGHCWSESCKECGKTWF